jgi:para-aminobenzoate synthetase
MQTLLIDNYDSFTYNLFQILAEVNGVEPTVVRNDEASWEELSRLRIDNVVLSPGPGRPQRERDFGVCSEVIRRCEVPLLGVCLGHQGLGLAYGGRVVPAPEAMHGRISAVEHSGSPLFAGIPSRFQAVRYHSLCLDQQLPDELELLAWAPGDGVAMAIAHRSRPQWGVQFHPESIAAEHGRRLLENFRDLSGVPAGSKRPKVAARALGKAIEAPSPLLAPSSDDGAPNRVLELRLRRLDAPHDPERVFSSLYADSTDAFWLDSSRAGDAGRFSFIGDASGPLGARISYDVDAREVSVERGGGDRGPGAVEIHAETIFDYLDRELDRLRPLSAALPFEFDCGFAGYLGYELKADCGGERAHSSPLPDAAFVFADRMLAFDHLLGHTYLLCLAGPEGAAAADAWLDATAARLAGPVAAGLDDGIERGDTAGLDNGTEREGGADGPPAATEFHLARPRQPYLDDIAECKRLLREGESYEICLTNAIEATVDADPLDLYRRLRRVNPAPFSAYLRFGGLAVLSSSPERFLKVDNERGVEARPIKGTSRRDPDPDEDARLARELRESEKNRAENLMIADLLRNDLGSVCEVGSVQVPALMEVETYETVHQLVSTVRGRLRAGVSALDCGRACFPPGSMTGAPKLRTLEILDRLEGRARGVYSGAIGYFGLGGGCDLSVAIRAIVLDRGAASIGAGGAIVLQSDPEEEYEEMLLKGRAPMLAIDPAPTLLREAGAAVG